MPRAAFDERLAKLEQRVTRLEGAHDAVRNEISSFRAEVRTEFAAVRSETAAEFAAVRSETAAEFAAVRLEMKTEFAAVRAEMKTEFAAVRSEMKTEFAAVRSEMRDMREELGASIVATNEETRRHMRVLHEDLVARIAMIGEGGSTPSGQSPDPSRRTGRRGSRR